MFTNPFPHAFGLDIGDLSIKLVQLRKVSAFFSTPKFEPVVHRSIQIPHGLIVDGELEQPELVREHITKLLHPEKGRQIKSRWVVASLPDSQGFLKMVYLEKNPNEVEENDVLYLAKKHIPFDEDEYYLTWQLFPSYQGNNKGVGVLIGAIPKKISDFYTYLLESLGLGVVALEMESLAISRAMITATKEYQNEARALLNIGATRSSLIIYDYDSIQMSISLNYSGEIITTAISQKLHIPYEEAEKIKHDDGLSTKSSTLLPILTQITDDLTNQIQKGLNFYYSHFPEPHKITHITMCGGGAGLKKLDKILSYKLKINSRPGKVWKNLLSGDLSISDQESLRYASAVGLALRAADNPFLAKRIY